MSEHTFTPAGEQIPGSSAPAVPSPEETMVQLRTVLMQALGLTEEKVDELIAALPTLCQQTGAPVPAAVVEDPLNEEGLDANGSTEKELEKETKTLSKEILKELGDMPPEEMIAIINEGVRAIVQNGLEEEEQIAQELLNLPLDTRLQLQTDVANHLKKNVEDISLSEILGALSTANPITWAANLLRPIITQQAQAQPTGGLAGTGGAFPTLFGNLFRNIPRPQQTPAFNPLQFGTGVGPINTSGTPGVPQPIQPIFRRPIQFPWLASKDIAADYKGPIMGRMTLTMDSNTVTIEDGVLTADAIATAVMVQVYGDKKVLKDPEELKKSCDFAMQLPITDQHPEEGIVMNQDEIKGWTSPIAWNEDKQDVRCSIRITDGDLIKKVEDGNTDVSIGFFCDLDETPGTFQKDEYDAVQRNIVMNHLACGLAKGNGRCDTNKCGIGNDSTTGNGYLPCVDDHYAWLMQDAENNEKLTAAQRTALPDEAFAGPDRSFPVPDCAHYTAAKQMLSRYQGEGDKEEIGKKIEDLGKALSCPGAIEETEEDESTPIPGDYILANEEAHEHTVTLNEEGSGTSSKTEDHTHEVFKMVVQPYQANNEGHTHQLIAVTEEGTMTEENKDVDNPEDETDEGAPVHQELLNERAMAITTLAKEIAEEGMKMEPDMIREKISELESLSWKLSEPMAVLRANSGGTPESMDAADKAMADAKAILANPPVGMTDEKKVELAEAAKLLEDEKATIVDNIMDLEPPMTREHFEKKSLDELREVRSLMSSQKDTEIPASSTSSSGKSGINDAYAEMETNLGSR